MRYLSSHEVMKCLSMPQAIEAMREAFRLLSDGKVVVPLRLHLDIPEQQGVELVKPVYVPSLQRIGIKVISLFRQNYLHGLPLSHALMMVFDATSGIPLALMDGNSLTAIRTGATAGLATDLLSRKNIQTLAIFGAGFQARYQIEAIRTVRSIKKILIFDQDISKAHKLAAELQLMDYPEVNVATKPEVLQEADVICTVTTSDTPVFSDSLIRLGVHINAMGSFKPSSREIPGETIQRAKVVVDQKEACLKEAGDILIPIAEGKITNAHIYAELGELVSGLKTGRESEREITLFKSVGNAVQDLLAAQMVLINSRQKDLGIELKL